MILIQGDDFFADHSNCRAAPLAKPSLLNWRSLSGSFRFSGRPIDTPQPSPHESRHRNFSLLPVGKSRCVVDVAPARDEDVSDSSPFQFHSIKILCRDMALPLNLMRKPLQLCSVRTTMRLMIQLNQVTLNWGYSRLKYDQSKHKHMVQLADQKTLCMKE
jgi:hypothetical protein